MKYADLKAENEALRRRLALIHKRATWDGYEEEDFAEPTEDDMIDALTDIHDLSWASKDGRFFKELK